MSVQSAVVAALTTFIEQARLSGRRVLVGGQALRDLRAREASAALINTHKPDAGVEEINEGQRPGPIPAWANGPGRRWGNSLKG